VKNKHTDLTTGESEDFPENNITPGNPIGLPGVTAFMILTELSFQSVHSFRHAYAEKV
jgi:hypothetical protein